MEKTREDWEGRYICHEKTTIHVPGKGEERKGPWILPFINREADRIRRRMWKERRAAEQEPPFSSGEEEEKVETEEVHFPGDHPPGLSPGGRGTEVVPVEGPESFFIGDGEDGGASTDDNSSGWGAFYGTVRKPAPLRMWHGEPGTGSAGTTSEEFEWECNCDTRNLFLQSAARMSPDARLMKAKRRIGPPSGHMTMEGPLLPGCVWGEGDFYSEYGEGGFHFDSPTEKLDGGP